MGVSAKPAVSRARRMAPTRPSIMSEGAIDVGAGARVGNGHPRQELEGGVVPHLLSLHDTAVPVGGVLAEAHVGHHHELPALGADGRRGRLHDAVVGIALAAEGVLRPGQAEEDDPPDAEGFHLASLAGGLVGGEVEAAGKGADLATHPGSGGDEEGVDELLRGKRGSPAPSRGGARCASGGAAVPRGSSMGKGGAITRHRPRRRTGRRRAWSRSSDRRGGSHTRRRPA